MKGKVRWLMISAVLTLGIGLIGSGASWGDEAGPPTAGAAADGQTVVAQADATTQAAPAETQTAPAATPSATTTTPGTGKVPTTEVTVTAQKEKPKEGSVEAGYKVDNVTTTGPWGQMALQDTPYSINVMSSDLIENVQTGSRLELFRMNPVVEASLGDTTAGTIGLNLRGFPASSNYNQDQYIDGILSDPYAIYLEDKERVEVLTGPTGFLYGFGDVGGLINYVLKRPTATPLADITVGDYGGSQYYAHGDFGGPIDKSGKFAYRLNIVTEDGRTEVDDQKSQRNLITGALDYHILDNMLLQFDVSYVHSKEDGILPNWLGELRAVPNPSKDWGEPYTGYEFDKTRVGAKYTWDINNMFSFRSAYSYAYWYSDKYLQANNTVEPNRTYNQMIFTIAPYYTITQGGYAFLDTKFTTGPVQHKVTTGFYGSYATEYDPSDIFAFERVTGLSLAQPTYVSEPALIAGTTRQVEGSSTANYNWMAGDEVTFTDHWSALAGLNYAKRDVNSYNTTNGERTSQYDKNALTPSASLLYKPIPWITTYATYMQSLEQGVIVPNSPLYTDAGKVFSPLMSYQYEMGAKATVGGTLLSLALFDIDKSNQFAVSNPNGTLTYTQDGREDHKGIEFTVTGKATEHLTLFGGFTLMDCEITSERDNPAIDGKRPVNVSDELAKLYAEYSLPRVPGLTFTGGAYYTGPYYADEENTFRLPGVIIGDVGARYNALAWGTPVIFRLNVTQRD